MMEVHGIMNAAGGAREHNEQSPSPITSPKKCWMKLSGGRFTDRICCPMQCMFQLPWGALIAKCFHEFQELFYKSWKRNSKWGLLSIIVLTMLVAHNIAKRWTVAPWSICFPSCPCIVLSTSCPCIVLEGAWSLAKELRAKSSRGS